MLINNVSSLEVKMIEEFEREVGVARRILAGRPTKDERARYEARIPVIEESVRVLRRQMAGGLVSGSLYGGYEREELERFSGVDV